nr:ImmA/IrrE family metallo-endopeptidase [uncultured Rhodopila sp.]
MTPSRPRYARIEQLTDGLLRDAGVTAPAVPIDDITRSRGITIRQMDLKEISGLVVRDADVTVIGVNKAHHLTRRRFTTAHELAHALLHEGKEVRYDKDFRVDFRSGMSSLGVDVEEMEANFFAACILMPRRFLEADPLMSDMDAEDAAKTVKALADRYKVSPHAMSIRLGNLAARSTSRAGVRG